MSDLKIRRAKAGDINQIHTCLADLAAYLGESDLFALTPEKLHKHGFAENPAFRVMIAESDGIIAGICLYFRTFSTWYGAPGIYVQDLYIKPDSRGRKLGEKLLSRVALEERANGATHLRLSVDKANAVAMAFYDRLGMVSRDKEEIRMLDGKDFIGLASANRD